MAFQATQQPLAESVYSRSTFVVDSTETYAGDASDTGCCGTIGKPAGNCGGCLYRERQHEQSLSLEQHLPLAKRARSQYQRWEYGLKSETYALVQQPTRQVQQLTEVALIQLLNPSSAPVTIYVAVTGRKRTIIPLVNFREKRVQIWGNF